MNRIEMKKTIKAKVLDFVFKGLGFPDNGDPQVQVLSGKLAEDIFDSIEADLSDEAFKAVGECKHCYGKGYSSVLEPAHVASPDFPGDKRTVVKPSRLEYRFCQCERGQALKHLILSNAHWVID